MLFTKFLEFCCFLAVFIVLLIIEKGVVEFFVKFSLNEKLFWNIQENCE